MLEAVEAKPVEVEKLSSVLLEIESEAAKASRCDVQDIEFLKERIKTFQTRLFLFKLDGALIGGSCISCWHFAGSSSKLSCMVSSFTIFKPFRRKGYGERSLCLLCNLLEKIPNCSEIFLGVHAKNKAAIALYEKCGFKKKMHEFEEPSSTFISMTRQCTSGSSSVIMQ